MDIFI